ncbi:NAD-dependent protein deacetylase, SIR2 family [Oceanirhabdus sp. W0125-5]|uniref:NAD-dependent protein deacetylase, SIR2 family n=1 Tax=Oceanirhabdus sp. W0125-5 TaxID=2999116 RepID=UPI0022F2E721|nr:NAD-dependent protein deacetylase, SIR2 family [Oceanirhabdus sp. W0125-5]WBW96707.1 NAD-dependent protein deacetylase, SIR2 family [Oceanirhabdus sp. W0125-5]
MFTKTYSQKLKKIKKIIDKADYVLVGAGAGLSAAGGLDYGNKDIFKEKYSPFIKKGYKTIWDGLVDNWSVSQENKKSFWGYWANHINNIYYRANLTKPYEDLYELIKDKNYFIITTNCDGQFYKGNFDEKKIFAPQGSYAYFQCEKPCSEDAYNNKAMIENMLSSFDEDKLIIEEEEVPICPRCGRLLRPNLRVDDTFVDKPHLANIDEYYEFVESAMGHKIVLLELGVGFNTPGIIRFPFERMVKQLNDATLIRFNTTEHGIRKDIKDKIILIEYDIKQSLEDLIKI